MDSERLRLGPNFASMCRLEFKFGFREGKVGPDFDSMCMLEYKQV
jgi:hypothetical protein